MGAAIQRRNEGKMKRFFTRKLLALMCMIACIAAMTACSQESNDQSKILGEESLKSSAEYNLQIVNEYSDSELNQVKGQASASGNEMLETFVDSLLTVRAECGKYAGTKDDWSYDFDGKTATVSVTTVYGERDVQFRMVFEETEDGETQIVSAQFEPVRTVGQKMSDAAVHTAIGMITVFFALIIIIALIYCLRYVPKLQKRIAASGQAEDVQAQKETGFAGEEPSARGNEADTEMDLADDLELVAVIAAAIAAMENTSADGLVVRSIRRVPNSKWKYASH